MKRSSIDGREFRDVVAESIMAFLNGKANHNWFKMCSNFYCSFSLFNLLFEDSNKHCDKSVLLSCIA